MKNSISSLKPTFATVGDGAIALPYELISDLFDFILNIFSYEGVSSALLYNLVIIAFWLMMRISEAARLCFDHVLLFFDHPL